MHCRRIGRSGQTPGGTREIDGKIISRFAAVFLACASNAVLSVGIPAPALANACGNTSTGNIAITDLGSRKYQGEQGGLYPGGSNVPPSAYRAAGIQAARSIVPLDGLGSPSRNGKVGFLAIGMSNTFVEFDSFTNSMASDRQRSQTVAMVNGAIFGADAVAWVSPASPAWGVVDNRLRAAGLTDKQVEVVWLKQADANPKGSFETYAHGLQQQLAQITAMAAQRYPNLRQVFVSARTYGGYNLGGPNPEPYAYETGFADKFFVAQWVANPSKRPWVGWGPYFWTDGTVGRADGLKWYCSDTVDGTHPSASGLAKVNSYMRSLFLTSIFTPWFTGATHIATAKPVANPRTGVSQPFAAESGPTSTTASDIASLISSPWSGLLVASILFVAAGIIAIGLLFLVRHRQRLTSISKHAVSGGGGNGTPTPPLGGPEAPQLPVLAGAPQIGERRSEGAGQPPAR
jgi:hypothetical protein